MGVGRAGSAVWLAVGWRAVLREPQDGILSSRGTGLFLLYVG